MSRKSRKKVFPDSKRRDSTLDYTSDFTAAMFLTTGDCFRFVDKSGAEIWKVVPDVPTAETREYHDMLKDKYTRDYGLEMLRVLSATSHTFSARRCILAFGRVGVTGSVYVFSKSQDIEPVTPKDIAQTVSTTSKPVSRYETEHHDFTPPIPQGKLCSCGVRTCRHDAFQRA
jgi:hypothetical protein